MKQLVVLVGLPGSGKTAYQREHPDWVVISRSRRWTLRPTSCASTSPI
ncbi:MAG: hypothetical protein NTV92_00465 [Candidatus Bipolaricaulota bacterium]|nr:hypothetical protein [Candidatus Bipolaricaulota bacterium]